MLADDHDFAARLAADVIRRIEDRFWSHQDTVTGTFKHNERAANVAAGVIARIQTALVEEN